MNDKFVKFFNHNRVLSIVLGIFVLLLIVIITMFVLNRKFFGGKTYVDGFVISDVKIKEDGDFYNFTAKITAIKAKEIKSVDITFLDKDKKEMIKINNTVNQKLGKNESVNIDALTDVNIKDAKKIKYKIN